MSEQVPIYSSNPVLSVIEHIGHGIHVAETDITHVVAKLPQYITAAEIAVKDAPTVVADTTAVIAAITGGSALFEALVAATASLGTNVANDISVVQAVLADAPKIGAYWTNVKAAVTVLLTTLGADEKAIAAVFAVPAVPAA